MTEEFMPPEKLDPEFRARLLATEQSLFLNVAKFEHANRVATMLSTSSMVPEQFQKSPGNCLIALNYADRIGADVFMLMQTMYIIHGKPGIEGKMVAGLINRSNIYSEPLQYEWLDGNDKLVSAKEVYNYPDRADYGCRAVTKDAKSGHVVEGPTITWKIVKAEGWDKDKKSKKTGYVQKSKWNTMPELMFAYRAASWFANKNCPDLKLGMQTVEEIRDTVDLTPQPDGSFALPEPGAAEKLVEVEPEPEPPEEHICKICGYECKSEQGLKAHTTRQHPLQTPAAKEHFAKKDAESAEEPDQEPTSPPEAEDTGNTEKSAPTEEFVAAPQIPTNEVLQKIREGGYSQPQFYEYAFNMGAAIPPAPDQGRDTPRYSMALIDAFRDNWDESFRKFEDSLA